MNKHYTIKEHTQVKGLPICSFRSYSLCGDPITANVYYVGDAYQVETLCEESEPSFEYFIHLSDAVAYAETV